MRPDCPAWIALFAAGTWVACGAVADPPPLGSDRLAIVNGQVDTADPAVVALVSQGQQYCSGTVVAPRVVITAAHCLPPQVAFAVDEISVYFGTHTDQPGAQVDAIDAIVNPLWNPDVVANDIGMVGLAFDAPTAPAAMLTESLAAQSGERARLVGFGITAADGSDNGVKRVGSATIRDTDASTLYLDPDPALTCNGDSGGPLFVERGGEWVFAGIHTRSDCLATALNERVDVHVVAEIEPFIAAHGGFQGACGADGVCDEDCSTDVDCGPALIARPPPITGGCSAGGPAGGGLAPLALALALAARSAAGRRRRPSPRR